MRVSQKCQYAVRAVLELAKHRERTPLPIGQIAESQAIPPRFLESILVELKQAGYVRSTRGVRGGYRLAASPKDLSVGDIIRLIDGPLDPVDCSSGAAARACPLQSRCALVALWRRAKEAVEEVYDNATFEELAAREEALERKTAADYCI